MLGAEPSPDVSGGKDIAFLDLLYYFDCKNILLLHRAMTRWKLFRTASLYHVSF